MREWRYKVRDAKGKVTSGILMAPDRHRAIKQLREQRLRPISISAYSDSFISNLIRFDEKGNISIQIGSGLPSQKEVAVFAKQLSIMIERGVPMIQALSILASQQKRIRFREIIERVKNLVENGSSLSAAFSMYPKVFDELFVAMVRSGEMSGNLDTALRETVKFLDKSVKLATQLKSASIYPAMIVSVACAITYGILVFLVPAFAEQYKDAGRKLPTITQFVIDVSDILQNQMPVIVIVLMGLFFFFRQYRATETGRVHTDDLALKMPVFGDLLKKIAVGRFSATMSTMLFSGVSILDALTICGESAGNKAIQKFVLDVRLRISRGANFAESLASGNVFPPLVISMVTVGEQTGALDQTLAKVSEIYEEEVENAVKSMMDMLQPVLIVTIGVVLGFVIVALYLPIMDSANLVGPSTSG